MAIININLTFLSSVSVEQWSWCILNLKSLYDHKMMHETGLKCSKLFSL